MDIKGFGLQAYDKFNNLLAGLERGTTKLLGIDEILQYASRRPNELGFEGEHRGAGDALRHLLLAAEMQRQHPWLAQPLLYGHEYLTNMLQGQKAEEREQDVANNQLGFGLGQQAMSRDDVERLALMSLKNARMLPQQDEEYK